MRGTILGPVFLALLAGTVPAADGLRVAAWNITNYSGGNASSIATAVYGAFEGRSFEPDVIMLQEMTSATAVNLLVSALNSAGGSPGDWAAGNFFGGASGGLNTALVYRQGRLDLVNAVLLWPGSATLHPRNIVRYDLRLDGYQSEEATVSLYPVHMKAGSGSDDQSRRLTEAQRIRDDSQALPEGRHFFVGGDFNIQSSSQAAYQELVGSQSNNAGRFFDPIAAPGSWNNSFTYRMLHTQDPVGAGGMDDRHDQILVSATVGDGIGLDYRGLFATPWNLARWDDPNHSYRCWGNDGATFDLALRTTGNLNVGATIAQALKTMAGGGGHLPVYLDLIVPPRGQAQIVSGGGVVSLNEVASVEVEVLNAGDTARWGATGIGALTYSFDADPGLTAPVGEFVDAAGGGVNTHVVGLDTSAVGEFVLDLVVLTDDPEQPTITLGVSFEVVNPCPADVAEPFGVLDLIDVNAFVTAFVAADGLADIAPPQGVLDLLDVDLFVTTFFAGCP